MNKERYSGLSGGLFLIGLGVLFLAQIGIWPWILVVIGLSSLPASLAMKRGWYGWQSLLWLVGLAILFATGYFWPGILILIGINTLVGGLGHKSEGSPFAPSSDYADVDSKAPFAAADPDEEQ